MEKRVLIFLTILTSLETHLEVKLRTSINGEDQCSEAFLVFRKGIRPQGNVINRLQNQAGNCKEKDRIQRSGEKPQPIEVAFKLQEGKITTLDNCVLFAYFPTVIKTDLRFLIQARYQPTPPRENIINPSESLWNGWLLEETANFLPEILEQLKDDGLLEPAFFNVLPLDGEVENDFKPIADALRGAVKECALIPTEKEGHYAKAEDVFYPDSTQLRKLVKSIGMLSDNELLHPDIQNNEKFRRCFKVMREAGVEPIRVGRVLTWLEGQSVKWFEARTNKWLRSLYNYLKEQESHLERIKKLPLVRLEDGQHVCTSNQLVFFPPDTDEDLEDIKPLLNDLRILKSTLLKKEGYNDIKAFLRDIGVERLNPENLITESICPLYSQPNKPAVIKNRRHVRYIFESWQKTEESERSRSERSRLEKSVSEVPILRAYKGTQRETSDFVIPCNTYLPQAYTGDDDLETYFSVSDVNFWFVDDKYLTNKSDRKAWLQFLKAIGAMDTPRVIPKKISRTSENYQEFDEELKKRNIKSEYSSRWWKTNIEDFYLQGLSEVLDKISKHGKVDFSRIIWHLLVKMVNPLPTEVWSRNTFFNNLFQGKYHWFYRTDQRKFFDATFYGQLKSTAWIPGKHGKFHIPSECFLPTDDNREILGGNVPYLPSDFDISTRPARWLADQLDVRLEADPDNVLNYLQTLSREETGIEDVEPIYKFLESEDVDLGRFEEERLIYTPEPEPRWWQTHEVFWEDESPVFGDHCGYLADYYGDPLKGFFTELVGVRKRAEPSDYIRVIQNIASAEMPEDLKVRERVQKLYRCLWRSLQEKGDSLEGEEWQEKWEQVQEDACWLGRKGDEWEFYLLEELVWNDHNYCAEVVACEVPFWEFGDDLLEFAKYLGVEGCYQASNIECDPYSDKGECTIESEKVQKLVPYIHDFLNSTPWRGVYSQEETTEILDRLSVRRAQKLEVRYNLKGKSVPDRTPRQSFLDPTSQGTILWLGLEENQGAYPDLIGDALQDHFGINELREFIKDLLLTTDPHRTTLLNWERRGFEPDRCLSPPELDSKEDNKNASESVDEERLDEESVEDYSGTDDSEVETPVVHEKPETESEGSDSTRGASDTPTHRPRPGRGGARWPGGSGGSAPNRNRSTGYGGGGGGEGEEHRTLKEYLGDNPSLFGEGLELVNTEYRFRSGDEADILFKDSSGNPVTVEVKPPILSGSDQEVWQAVKYKHLAAVEYGLPCEQVRSILAAPEIPDDVKEECERRGIESFEVTQR